MNPYLLPLPMCEITEQTGNSSPDWERSTLNEKLKEIADARCLLDFDLNA